MPSTAAIPVSTRHLSYAVVDMHLNGGYGDVTAKRDVFVASTNLPRVTAVRHANNRDFWVLTRDEDTRGFQAFRVSAQGVAPEPVRSLTGTARFPSPQDNGLKVAPDGRHLACGVQYYAPDGTARSGVATYVFDPATGEVSQEQIIYATLIPNYLGVQGPGTRPIGGGLILSTSFSPDSHLLYVVEYPKSAANPQPRGTEIYQFDLTQPTSAAIAQSRYWVSNVPTLTNDYPHIVTYSLQLAPDGTLWADGFYRRNPNPGYKVYRALSSAIVRRPNAVGAGCGFEPEGYAHLPGQWPIFLPNVITNLLYALPALNAGVGCPTDSVAFWASSAGPAAGLRWDFGDPGSGAANAAQGRQTVAHRYARAGRYSVSLTLPAGPVLRREVEIAPSAADFTGATIFTPNGDGLNEAFVPVRGPLAGYRLRVFSRWGQLVYDSPDPAQPWTGTGQAAGEYFYQLSYVNCENQPRQQRGVVTLSR
ncbi:MAG: gliding motility-associated C-terminal domain-containing protein [Bacteroidota bacterium]|nr:gliding motility-associated C-terminal domain-containing protein [Bacteroidota bacterium]